MNVALDFTPNFYDPFVVNRRRRTSRKQIKTLERAFHENPKPNAAVRRAFASRLSMTPRSIQVWFQNRRAKAKNQRQQDQQLESHDNVPASDFQPDFNLPTFISTPMALSHSQSSLSSCPGSLNNFLMPSHNTVASVQPLFNNTPISTISWNETENVYPVPSTSDSSHVLNHQDWCNLSSFDYQNAYPGSSHWSYVSPYLSQSPSDIYLNAKGCPWYCNADQRVYSPSFSATKSKESASSVSEKIQTVPTKKRPFTSRQKSAHGNTQTILNTNGIFNI